MAQFWGLLFAFLLAGFSYGDELRATTIEEPPYLTTKVKNPTKNEDFKGYIVDLLKEISEHIGSKFKLHLVEDKKYGAQDDGGQWNGMIGEVVNNKADVVAAPLTKSTQRDAVVDFTEIFMNFDTVVLMKKDAKALKIKNAHDLLNQEKIKFVVVKDGFTENFFKNAQSGIYKSMYSNMTKYKDEFPLTSGAGVKKVRDSNGEYAFIIESSTADYWMEKAPCDLWSFRLGSALPAHDYAFAVKQGNVALKNRLNEAIRKLKNDGKLDVIRSHWWPRECSSGHRILISQRFVLLVGFASLLVIFARRL